MTDLLPALPPELLPLQAAAVPFDSRYSYLVGAVLGGFLLLMAVVVWRFSSDRPGRLYLGAYLFLVGANNLIVGGQYLAFGTAGGPDWAERVAQFIQLFDPPILLVAVVAVTARRVPSWLLGTALALALGAATIFAVGLTVPGAASWTSRVLSLQLAVLYGAGFAWFAFAFARERRSLQRERLAEFVVAFGAVLLTRIPLSVNEAMVSGEGKLRPETALVLVGMLAGLYALAALLLWAASLRDARRTVAKALARLGLALAIVAAVWVLYLEPQLSDVSHSLWYSSRWLVFAAILGASIHRLGLLDLREEGERRLWLAMSAAVFLTMVAILWTFLSGNGAVSPLAGLFASLTIAGLFHGLFIALLRSHGRRGATLEWRQVSLYRAHLELGTGATELAGLRERLQIGAAQARKVEELVALERTTKPSAQELLPGQVFAGRYEVRSLLGVGGFGRAFRAFDRVGSREVVLKELLEGWKRDPKALARFRNEIRALLKVSHPNLVGFRDLERGASGHVLVLEYVPGPLLRERMEKTATLGLRQAARLGSRLMAGLATLHGLGIAHGDVKPENIVLRKGGAPVLLDFGGARVLANDTRAAPEAGTEAYLSPERRGGRPATPADDVYAAATVLWECASGALPGHGSVAEPLRSILLRGLDSDARRRPDAVAMGKALDEALP